MNKPRLHPNTTSAAHPKLTRTGCHQNALNHHITPVIKSLHRLKIPERIHFKVLSITYNSLQSSKPTYLHELFTIQPTRSIRSSSCLTLSRHPSPLFSRSPKSHIRHCTASLE